MGFLHEIYLKFAVCGGDIYNDIDVILPTVNEYAKFTKVRFK